MGWRFFFSFLCVSVSTCLGQSTCPQYPPLVETLQVGPLLELGLFEVQQLLKTIVSSRNLPNLVYSIVYNQQILASGGLGKQNPFDIHSGPPDGNSGTRIASITKTFTATWLYKLRDIGLIPSLDLPLKALMPDFSVKRLKSSTRPITLRQLACHGSGLQREEPVCGQNPKCTEAEVLTALKSRYLVLEEYERAHYSNLGFALLGRGIEKATNSTYEAGVTQDILLPLQMRNSTFNTSIAKPRLMVGVGDNDSPAPTGSLGWSAPAGQLYSTANDMAKFMSFLFSEANPVLDRNTINEMTQSVFSDRGGVSAFGTPWEYNRTNDMWVIAKAGELEGYRSQISMAPLLKLGVFISVGKSAVESPSVWTNDVLSILIKPLISSLVSLQGTIKVPVPSRSINEYAGKYSNGMMLKVKDKSTLMDEQGNTYSYVIDDMFRMNLVDDSPCRWYDDGPNLEFAYFQCGKAAACSAVRFMESEHTRIS